MKIIKIGDSYWNSDQVAYIHLNDDGRRINVGQVNVEAECLVGPLQYPETDFIKAINEWKGCQ